MKDLKFTAINGEQAKKILKALAYSFVSGFTGSFVLVSSDVIKAASGGFSDLNALLVPLFIGAVVAGVNTVLVTVKQFFTDKKSA